MSKLSSPASTSPPPRVDALLLRPKFTGVVMVCGDCEKRSSGPSKLKAKHVRKEFKRDLSGLPIRLRIVQCSCLGLCPKKAIAAAAAAGGGEVIAVEICAKEDAHSAAAHFAAALAARAD